MGVDTRLYAAVPNPVTKQQVDRWAYELAVCFRSYVEHGQSSYNRRKALFFSDGGYEDNDPEVPENHTLLEVNQMMRYYGKGYERGPITGIIMIAEWLEVRLNAKVFYGCDSGGYALPFNKEDRAEIFQHFCNVVGESPYRGFKAFPSTVQVPICEYCNEPMISSTMGPYERYVFQCMACDHKPIVVDLNSPELQASYASWVK